MKPKTSVAAKKITKAFRGFNGFSEKKSFEMAFHLTDWIDDLAPLVSFLETPAKYKDEEIQRIVIRFLAHAPDHLRQASNFLFDDDSIKKKKMNARANQ